MVGHARLACDEAGHWLSGLARAEQVSQREEVKGAASENKNSIADRFPKGLKIEQVIFSTKKKRLSGFYLFVLLMPTAAGELRAIQAATRARTSRRRAPQV